MRDIQDKDFAGEAADYAARVIEVAAARGVTVATAESLTGGSVAAALVAVPGASTAFQGSVVAYSHQAKTCLLGVDANLLAQVGAVDRQVAVAMAEGARSAFGVDFAVSTTGVAGPDAHDGKPVGTVMIGICGPQGSTTFDLQISGDRTRIRQISTCVALEKLAAHCRFSVSSQ